MDQPNGSNRGMGSPQQPYPPPSTAPRPMPASPAASPPSPAYATPQPPPPAVYERKAAPHILIRAAYYLLIGWWLAGLGMLVAWIAAITIIGIPIAFWLVNRVPTMLTLRPRTERYQYAVGPDGVTREVRVSTEQSSFLVRAVWFLIVGWWASALWMIVSYVLMLTIIGIPIGLMMANRLPFIFSLHRGYS